MKDNRSVLRILSILELVAQHDQGITLSEIYRTLGMAKATAYDILQTLYKVDAVYYKDPFRKTYAIGSKMYAIGSVYTKNSSLIEASTELLKSFADQHQRVVTVAKKIEENVVFVHKYHPPQATLNILEEVGSVISLSNEHLACETFRRFQKPSDETPMILMSPLEAPPYRCTLACPVFNFENKVVGAIVSDAFLEQKSDRTNIAQEFNQIAQLISKRLGYLRPSYHG